MRIDCLQKWTFRSLKKQLVLSIYFKKRDIIRESNNDYLTDRFQSVKVLPCQGSSPGPGLDVCLMCAPSSDPKLWV